MLQKVEFLRLKKAVAYYLYENSKTSGYCCVLHDDLGWFSKQVLKLDWIDRALLFRAFWQEMLNENEVTRWRDNVGLCCYSLRGQFPFSELDMVAREPKEIPEFGDVLQRA